jgi:hypothetical protein
MANLSVLVQDQAQWQSVASDFATTLVVLLSYIWEKIRLQRFARK